MNIAEQSSVHNDTLYSAIGAKEQIKCLVSSYPTPKMTLLLNDIPVSAADYNLEESKTSDKQYALSYSFIGSPDTFGVYRCVAENELGASSAELRVTPQASVSVLTADKLPAYSDAVIFEWSVLSGSAIQELNLEVLAENSTNATNLITRTKHKSSDGLEQPATYLHEHVMYKDFYDLANLSANTTYTVRLRVKNEFSNEWSEWSRGLIVRTHPHTTEKLSKQHKSYMHYHHKLYHDKKHRNHAMQTGLRDLNGKRGYNPYLAGKQEKLFSFSVHRKFHFIQFISFFV